MDWLSSLQSQVSHYCRLRFMKKHSEVTHISMAGNRKRAHTHTVAKQVNRSSQKLQERRGEKRDKRGQLISFWSLVKNLCKAKLTMGMEMKMFNWGKAPQQQQRQGQQQQSPLAKLLLLLLLLLPNSLPKASQLASLPPQSSNLSSTSTSATATTSTSAIAIDDFHFQNSTKKFRFLLFIYFQCRKRGQAVAEANRSERKTTAAKENT